MKKYKLLKDLPPANEGDEVTAENKLLLSDPPKEWPYEVFNLQGEKIAEIPYHKKNEWIEEIPEKPKSVWDLIFSRRKRTKNLKKFEVYFKKKFTI